MLTLVGEPLSLGERLRCHGGQLESKNHAGEVARVEDEPVRRWKDAF